MTLVIENPNVTQNQLTHEFYTSLFDNTLTQARYDEIIEESISQGLMADTLLGMIWQGQPTWREKHIERLNIKTAM